MAFCISVGNFQLAVWFISESRAKARFNWNFCPCLQDVRKSSFLSRLC